MLAWLSLLAAFAQTARTSLDGHGIVFVPQNGELVEPLATYRPTRPCSNPAAADVFFERAERPVELLWRQEDGSVHEEVWLDDVYAANLGVLGACHPILNVGATWPMYLSYATEQGPQRAAVGDPRISVHLSVPDTGRARSPGHPAPWRMGLVMFSDFPLGPPAGHVGRYRVSAGGLGMVSWESDPWSFAANAGLQVLPRTRVADLRGGPQILASAAVGYEVSSTVGVGAELQGRGILLDTPVDYSRAPTELLLHGRFRYPKLPWFTVGAGIGLLPGMGSADWRVFVGTGTGDRSVESGRDPDWDGFTGDKDLCPAEAEILNGLRDEDGCPDALADVTVRVVDAVTRAPIPGALVVFDGITAEGPRAEFPARMPDHTVLLHVVAPGYADWSGEVVLVEGPQSTEVAMQRPLAAPQP